MTAPGSPQAWLDRFVDAIRANDLAAGRALFARDVVGYGVIADRVTDLDALVGRQWTPTWRRVAAWSIDDVDLVATSGSMCALAFTWTRVNADDHQQVRGRATVVLRDLPAAGWTCVHSHFSLEP